MRDEELRDDITAEASATDPPASQSSTVIRHEEELETGTSTEQVGSVRVHKHVDSYPVEKVVPREIERVDLGERTTPNENDSGEIETLPDGSVSIPVFEEELVVTKRLVVRERLIVRKATITEEHRIETELRRERVEVESDPSVAGLVEQSGSVEETRQGDPPTSV